MQFKDLQVNQKILIQIRWGEKNIEFNSEVLLKDDTGVYVTPYYYQDKPLEINIDMNSGIACNLFAVDPANGERVCWKNVDVKPKEKTLGYCYHIKTSVFKTVAVSEERRGSGRIVIRRPGQLFNPDSGGYTDIMIHDISDSGISFYAPASKTPGTGILLILLQDNIDGREFQVKINCTIARMVPKAGTVFYGCRINGDNREYLIYGFMKRLKMKNDISKGGQ